MSSPLLQFDPFDSSQEDPSQPGSSAFLKQQVADRLAAHRSKRGRIARPNLVSAANVSSANVSFGNAQLSTAPLPSADLGTQPAPERQSRPAAKVAPRSTPKPAARPTKSRADRIAAAVAERYAHSTTYREFLASEAERAIAHANANAEIAARNAEAVTAVQQQLLAELDLWDDGAHPAPDPAIASAPHFVQQYHEEWAAATLEPAPHFEARYETRDEAQFETRPDAQPASHPLDSGLTVRLYEDVGAVRSLQPEPRITYAPEPHDDDALHQLDQLDHEIAFRHTPVFDEPSPTVLLPANLIEFPRQLVAARKARPRIAEGPLREEADSAPAAAQLRIFEVDASQFSTAAAVAAETSLPEWSTIHLDATPKDVPAAHASTETAPDPASHIQAQLYVPLQVASLGHRVMAAAVDACLLGAAFLAAVSAFAYAVKSLPTGPVAIIASAATLLVLFVIYHMLFFTFGCATPGMRYARIGLCTFSDDNPTRAEMRRRVWLILLAACPLGLGILWSVLDEDSLGWHDRLSRIYQRSY